MLQFVLLMAVVQQTPETVEATDLKRRGVKFFSRVGNLTEFVLMPLKEGAPGGEMELPEEHSESLLHAVRKFGEKEITILLDIGRSRFSLDRDGDRVFETHVEATLIVWPDGRRKQWAYPGFVEIEGLSVKIECEGEEGKAIQLKLTFYSGVTGTVELDGRPIDFLLYDRGSDGIYDASDIAVFDVNRDGFFKMSLQRNIERILLARPFNFTGTTYELATISPDGLKVSFKKSDRTVPVRRAPLKGEPAMALSGPDLQGKVVSLKDYRGKVTLVMFWAES